MDAVGGGPFEHSQEQIFCLMGHGAGGFALRSRYTVLDAQKQSS
jgi:hypothetical protein